MEAVLELCGFVDALLHGLFAASEERWRTERVELLLQLLCACQRCLSLNGDCRPLLSLLQQLLPACQQVEHSLFDFFILMSLSTTSTQEDIMNISVICAVSDL